MKSKVRRILIHEKKVDGLEVITRFKSFSEIHNGIFTTIQRIKQQYTGALVYYKNENQKFTNAFIERNPECKVYANEEIDLEINSEDYLSWKLLPKIAKQISDDLELESDFSKWQKKIKVKLDRFKLVGKRKHLYLHPEAIIYPGVVFDVTAGPVIIDKNVIITSFSFIEGPCYIAEDSKIDNARITGSSIIGKSCRIGGEVENSIFENYSNKHHEGFVGHSHVGSWVNLGALCTTSDLKNNYGIIKINNGEKEIYTDTLKFGSIIGDFSKIGIGVMLNTGTIVDLGANISESRISGYVPAFSWLGKEKYRLDRFLSDTKKIMARRNIELSKEEEDLLIFINESQEKNNPNHTITKL